MFFFLMLQSLVPLVENKKGMVVDQALLSGTIEEGILEAKTECYEKDKVKSPPFFRSFYDNF
jgi:hypothetical protein